MQTEDIPTALRLERIKNHLDSIKQLAPALAAVEKESAEARQQLVDELTSYAMSVNVTNYDKDALGAFVRHPFHIYKAKGDNEGTWHLAVPAFVPVQLGWLEKSDGAFNTFMINRYVDWLGELPEALKQKVGWRDPLEIYLEGNALVGKDVDRAHQKFKKFIKKREGDKLVINPDSHFELLAALIKDGILPFVPQPVPDALRDNRKCDITLRDYQVEPWNELLKYSNIGLFFPASTGKTFFSIWALTHIKPPHIVACPTSLLVEQWKERIELYTDLKIGQDVEVGTYQWVIKHGRKQVWNLKVIDEVHHMPANEFSYMAMIQAHTSVGLSASPQREDGREEYIFALTGKPVGLSWEYFKKLGIIQNPPMHVWIVKGEQDRMDKLAELLEDEQKTVVFCDSIELGRSTARRFGIPHVYGDSKGKLETIKASQVAVVSRVGDEGLSLPDITRVIEINWLFGSRRQELQRFTRILHGHQQDVEPSGHIIMTADEYAAHHKRLFSVMDHGFKIVLHRQGMPDKTVTGFEREEHKPRKVRPATPRKARPTAVQAQPKEDANDFERQHPLLSLPGIQKKLATLTRAERLSVRVLYERPGQDMTKEDVWNMVGIGRPKDFANFDKLVQLGLIVKNGRKYRSK